MKLRIIIAKLVAALLLTVSVQSHFVPEDPTPSADLLAVRQLARDHRFGSSKADKNLARAAYYYQLATRYVTEGNILKDGGEVDNSEHHKLSGEVLYEYSQFLELYPHLTKQESAFELLVQAADEGMPEAQFKLSTVYATGVYMGELVPMDAGRALYLNYMAALGGVPLANMAMGYRFLNGLGVKESCQNALPFYELAADIAAEQIERTGQTTLVNLPKLGTATTVSKSEVNQELVDYYTHLAEKGDASAAIALGQVLVSGTRLVPRNIDEAARLLSIAAEAQNAMGKGMLAYVVASEMVRRNRTMQHWSSSGDSIHSDRLFPTTPIINEYMRKPADVMEMLQFSAQFGDVYGQMGMGLVNLYGKDIFGPSSKPQNKTRAIELFRKHLGAHADAGYYLGNIMMETFSGTGKEEQSIYVDYKTDIFNSRFTLGMQPSKQKEMLAVAVHAYSISSQLGHVLSQHKFSHMTMLGLGVPRSCTAAIMGFKSVAERGDWASSLARAHDLLADGHNAAALFLFSQFAVVGYETAQFNAAYMLSQSRGRYRSADTLCPMLQAAPSPNYAGKARFNQSVIKGNEFQTSQKDGEEEGAGGREGEGEVNGITKESAEGIKEQTKNAATADDEEEEEDDGKLLIRSNKVSYLDPKVWMPFSAARAIAAEAAAAIALDPPLISGTVSQYDGQEFKRVNTDLRSVECDARALTLFGLSAAQGNDKAFLLLGDFYYYGYAGLKPDVRAAAEHYKRAADRSHNSHALFNLGVLHMGATPADFFASVRSTAGADAKDGGSRNRDLVASFSDEEASRTIVGSVVSGHGSSSNYEGDENDEDDEGEVRRVEVDFHLAKRYFDQAAAVDSSAEVPRDIALALMRSQQQMMELLGPTGPVGKIYEAHGFSAYERLETAFRVLSNFNEKVLNILDACADTYLSIFSLTDQHRPVPSSVSATGFLSSYSSSASSSYPSSSDDVSHLYDDDEEQQQQHRDNDDVGAVPQSVGEALELMKDAWQEIVAVLSGTELRHSGQSGSGGGGSRNSSSNNGRSSSFASISLTQEFAVIVILFVLSTLLWRIRHRRRLVEAMARAAAQHSADDAGNGVEVREQPPRG